MPHILDRAEFYALAVLFRASTIVGLDAAALVAADPKSQQELFTLGHHQLQDRELIRPDSQGSIDLERDLSEQFAAIVLPEQIVMVLRRLPAGERDLLMFYERGGVFVELTIPRTGIYRLARIGSADSLIARVLEVLPITDRPYVPEALSLSGSRVATAFQHVLERHETDAHALLETASTDDATLARYLVDVFASATFAGAITLVRPTAEGSVRSSDITVIHSPDESWSLVSQNGSDRVWAERMNAAALRSTLTLALARTAPAAV